jgi:hypothetical protein
LLDLSRLEGSSVVFFCDWRRPAGTQPAIVDDLSGSAQRRRGRLPEFVVGATGPADQRLDLAQAKVNTIRMSDTGTALHHSVD